MIKIERDKPAVYQWDLNRRVVLTNIDAGIEVHFSSIYDSKECSMVAPSYKQDGVVYADIPNKLLQESGIISVYLYVQEEDEAWTEHRAEILVLPRNKPANYVYTETEVFSYKKLEERMTVIEENAVYVEKAQVGQIVKVADVDEYGVPVKWEAIDMPVTKETDPTVPDWAKQAEKPKYTAADVGADAAGTANSKIFQHNTDTLSHNDLRLELKALSDRINAILDSDDVDLDELSEIVAYIKSNKELIDAITVSKVSVVDIIDNLVTNVSNKPLSAAQGVALKKLIDNAIANMGSGISVTAKPGQLVFVKSVDENGKPVEWEPMDRTHWVESTVYADGEYTSYFSSSSGCFVFDCGNGSGVIPETMSVVFDGVGYNNLKSVEIPDMGLAFGNLSFMNVAMGTAYENTGEPFIIGVSTTGMTFMLMTETESTKHTVRVITNEIVHKLPGKFLPDGVPHIERGMVEILPETTVALEGGEGMISGNIGLEDGKTYIVNWNGADYEIVATWSSELNGTCVIAPDDSFLVGDMPEVECVIIGGSSALASVTLSISQKSETVHKLHSKLLPEGVPYVEEKIVCLLKDIEIADKTSDEMADGYLSQEFLSLVPGEKYIVKFNELEYKATATLIEAEGTGVIILGNASMMSPSFANTGEPFYVFAAAKEEDISALGFGVNAVIFYGDEGAGIEPPDSCLFSLYHDKCEVGKLDNRCLDMAWVPTKEKTVKIEKMSVNCSMDLGDGLMGAIITSGVDVKSFVGMVGQEVECIVDGTSYLCTVKEYVNDRPETISLVERDIYVGNAVLASSSRENTGEPFLFTVGISMDGDIPIFTCGTAPGVHTFEMYGDIKVNTLPKEFLPESVPYVEQNIVTCLPEQEVTFEANEEMGGLVVAALTPEKNVLDGTYIITFDGVEYVCESVLEDDEPPTYVLGNFGLFGEGDDTGEPFAMMAADNIQMMMVKEAGTYTVGIKCVVKVPHMDESLLPKTVLIDLKALGLGTVHNSDKVELILTDGDRSIVENQLRIAEKQGIVKLVFDFELVHMTMLYPAGTSVGTEAGNVTLPMTIRKWGGGDYKMSALMEDNIIHVEYCDGTFYAIARRLTLAMEA